MKLFYSLILKRDQTYKKNTLSMHRIPAILFINIPIIYYNPKYN